MLGGHHYVGATIGFTSDNLKVRIVTPKNAYSDLGAGGLSVGIKQLTSVSDNTVMLLFTSREISRNINEGYQRNVEGIAEANESRIIRSAS